MATIDEIKQQAAAVKNATQVGENTALRVGGVLVDLCEYMKNLSDNAGSGGGGTSGGSGVSLGTLLTKLNSDNPFPTANGQVLTYDGSDFVWKIPTGSGGSSSSSRYPLTIYNGSSNTDYITYDGSSSAYLRFKSGFSISKTGLGYEISVSGGGSGSRIKKIKLFNTHSDYSFETIDLGTADTIGFMAGDNITLEAVVKEYTNVIKISAKGGNGGSGGSTSTSVSWSDVTNKPSTFTPSSHTHSTSDINGLSNYVQGIKVDNATNADKAKQLAHPRRIWGQNFNGTGNISGNLYMDSEEGDSIQLWMNNGNMLDRTGNTLHIGYGLKESSDGEINLDANVTKIYTDNYSKHYDFKINVFDVNSNQIHFGSETNGGRISWDAANNAFKIEGNVYATGGITALGVSNSATTSNNVDFTFNKVSARGGTFENLAAGGMTFQNGVISYFQHTLSLKSDIMLYSGNSNCSLSLGNNTFTLRILSDIIKGFSSQGGGALSLNNVEKLIFGVTGQHYSRYKFDINKAISTGILVSTTETFSDEEADDTAVVAS